MSKKIKKEVYAKKEFKNKNIAVKGSKELLELIYFENLFDPSFQFEDVPELNGNYLTGGLPRFAKDKTTQDSNLEFPEQFRSVALKKDEKLQEITTKLPKELQELISSDDKFEEAGNYRVLAETITQLRACAVELMVYLANERWLQELSPEEQEYHLNFREDVRKQVNGNKHEMFNGSRTHEGGIIIQRPVGDLTYHSNFHARVSFGSDYKLDFKSNYLMEVLRGIDVRRLRMCSVCLKIFWAMRLDKKFCDANCKNIHSQRELRNNPERNSNVNKQRRTSYRNQVEKSGKEYSPRGG